MRLIHLSSVLLIFALGLMMVYNTTSAEVLDRALPLSHYHALVKQLLFAFVGALMAYFIWRIGYDNIRHLARPLYFIILFLLILVFVPKVGLMRNGARRWIALGPISFQPSELMKFLLPMVVIDHLLSNKAKKLSLLSFCKLSGLIALPIVLVIKEPDNGTAAVMGVSILPLFFLAKIPLKYWAIPMAALAILSGVIAYNVPYVRSRLAVYLDPTLDIQGKGHQPYQAKIAAGSGQILGRGAGASLQKLTYLPEAKNDYIAAIFAEEFGFLGIVGLVTLYLMLSLSGYTIAFKAKDEMGLLLAMSMTFLLSFQAFLNLGVVSGLLPSKGVNLPFFSQGGTSLIASIIATTLILNIAKHQRVFS